MGNIVFIFDFKNFSFFILHLTNFVLKTLYLLIQHQRTVILGNDYFGKCIKAADKNCILLFVLSLYSKDSRNRGLESNEISDQPLPSSLGWRFIDFCFFFLL